MEENKDIIKQRKRVRAVIIEDNKILLMHRIKHNEEYWAFPGGGLEDYDISPEEGLKRECFEELGVIVEVGGLFIEKISIAPHTINQIELFYKCNIIGGKVGTGTGPEFVRNVDEYGSYEVEWLPINIIEDKNVWPCEVRDKVIMETHKSLQD